MERVIIKNNSNNNNSRRWTVLTNSALATYESERNYSSPTEVVEVTNIKTIKSDDNSNSFIFVRKYNPIVFLNPF